jgi:hypothetical protein
MIGTSGAGLNPQSGLTPTPTTRCLRVFAFDPQASTALDTAVINEEIVQLPWERAWEDDLGCGPVNEYVEVVDFDPVSGCFYEPVDLNHPTLLAQSGLPPSDGNPQFHQQMVFAVVMKTIRSFERALGRPVLWMKERTSRAARDKKGAWSERDFPDFVRTLRIYPHAMREANAYYSPQKTALLFGYFRGTPTGEGTGGDWVFTCLSQDIIAHETTHAILHGLWRRSVESTNVDTLAFHEAFADVVALLQHFSSRLVTEHQLARSGGDLRAVSLLTGLAQQFGRATGREGPLRFALKMLVEEERALANKEVLKPDRHADIIEPHKRGQILVAAIFDAFVTIFERRTEDLFRMSRCSRRDKNLPDELVSRLAQEADRTAGQVLTMCIRGLDYMPPVDATFGEYLRAVLTADADLVPDDRYHYRTAFAEAFNKRGIRGSGQSFCSTETLYWERPEPFSSNASGDADSTFSSVLSQLHLGVSFGSFNPGTSADTSKFILEQSFAGATAYTHSSGNRNLRDLAMMVVRANQAVMHDWLAEPGSNDCDWERMLGIRFAPNASLQSIRVGDEGNPTFEVQSVRVSRRFAPNGDILPQLFVQVVQTRRGYLDEAVQHAADTGTLPTDDPRLKRGDFTFRGGATLIVDLRDGHVHRVVRKRIDDNARLASVRAFKLGDGAALGFGEVPAAAEAEPFAFMHRSGR